MAPKEKFIKSLIGIYNLDIINYFMNFLQGEQAVLFALYIGDEQNPSKISEKLGITKSRMSNIITKLLEKDMIETKSDVLDRRKIVINLKESGRKFIKEKESEILTIFEVFYLSMGETKIKQLSELLEETTLIMKEVRKWSR